MITHQSLFDTIATHLLTQGRKAQDAMGHCLYRGPHGTKCAIGAIIPDEIYSPEIEKAPVSWLLSPTNEHKLDLSPQVRDYFAAWRPFAPLLQKLQKVHDRLLEENWRAALTEVADEFGLSKAVLS